MVISLNIHISLTRQLMLKIKSSMKSYKCKQQLYMFEISQWPVGEQLCLAFSRDVHGRIGALFQGSKLSSCTTCFTVLCPPNLKKRGKLFVYITSIGKYLSG